jgi:hypothetical protein
MTTKPRLIGGVFLCPLFSTTPKAKTFTSDRATPHHTTPHHTTPHHTTPHHTTPHHTKPNQTKPNPKPSPYTLISYGKASKAKKTALPATFTGSNPYSI